jgi:hypothetical protein
MPTPEARSFILTTLDTLPPRAFLMVMRYLRTIDLFAEMAPEPDRAGLRRLGELVRSYLAAHERETAGAATTIPPDGPAP